MDYKYIEQLLEKYWECETSAAEEDILRTFFAQDSVPAHLRRYQPLFAYQKAQAGECLGADFDKRMDELIGREAPVVKATRMTTARRLRPLFRAAASVAIVLLLGNAAQRSFDAAPAPEGWDYNSAAYTDTYENPEAALGESIEALRMIQDGLKTARAEDSLRRAADIIDDKSVER